MGTVATVVLDDVDITSICEEGRVTKRLNGVATAAARVQMKRIGELYGTFGAPGAGAMLKVYLQNSVLGSTPVLWHHGRVLLCETSADEDSGYVVYNSSDPLELWQRRPVRDDDGDFSNPAIIETYKFGTDIIAAMFANSEDTTFGGGGPPPADAEGPLRLALGLITAGVTDLTGAPVDWPITMAELAALLISTGTVDAIVTPIEFDANDNYGRLDLYNGDYGQDLSSSVAFQYGMGARNVRRLRWNEDMTNVCNKLWYYLGPRKPTPADAQGNQHWAANITGDDPGLAYPPGGATSPPASATNNQVGVARYDSQQDFDVRMDIKIFDARGDEAIVAHDLYRRLWQLESFLRATPQTLIHVTPNRDTGIGEFDIGDLVLVEASSDVRGGFSGAQRVYGYTVSWTADDSVPELSELQVSSDQEAFTA